MPGGEMEEEVAGAPAGADGLMDAVALHYCKKELLQRQLNTEFARLTDVAALENVGSPYAAEEHELDPTALPMLRFFFQRFVVPFPFLAGEGRDAKVFWRVKMRDFLHSFSEKDVSRSDDHVEATKRLRAVNQLQKMIGMLFSSGVKTVQPEQSLMLTQEDRDAIDSAVAEKLKASVNRPVQVEGIFINVSAVRVVREPGFRSASHVFLLRTCRPGHPDACVSRRYSDFVELIKALRRELPGKELPHLPRKDKTSAMARQDGFSDSESVASLSPRSESDFSENILFPRERNRLTLRAFLQLLAQDEAVLHSYAFEKFLYANQIEFTAAERADELLRLELDNRRTADQLRFNEIARARSKDLEQHMRYFRLEIMKKNGLSRLFKVIREEPSVESLPLEYQKVIEWARIEVASTIYRVFNAQDDSSENLAQLKRIHSLMPYGLIKLTMRFSNPMTMMRGILDIFLAQPFGARSLLQRMMSVGLTGDLQEVSKSIEAVESNLRCAEYSQKLKEFVESPQDVKDLIYQEAEIDQIHPIIAVLRSSMLSSTVSEERLSDAFMSQIAWMESLERNAAFEQEAQLFAYLSLLLRLYVRRRDKEQFLSLVFDGSTGILMRDLVSIFFEPLARVYRAASIHNSVSDLSSFVDDLIKVVEKADKQTLDRSPDEIVQSFIDLTERHQNSFWKFAHEVHKNDGGLFEALISWIESIIYFMRDGSGLEKMDMEQLIRDAGPDLDKAALKRDLEALKSFQRSHKYYVAVKAMSKLAKLAGRTGSNASGDPSTLPDNSITGTDFGLDADDLLEIQGLDDMDIQDMDDDEISREERGDDGDDNDNDPDGQSAPPRVSEMNPLEVEWMLQKRARLRKRKMEAEPQMPDMPELAKLQKPFVKQLLKILRC